MSDDSTTPAPGTPKQIDLEGLSDGDIRLVKALLRLLTTRGDIAEAEGELNRVLGEWKEHNSGWNIPELDLLVAEAVSRARCRASTRHTDDAQGGSS